MGRHIHQYHGVSGCWFVHLNLSPPHTKHRQLGVVIPNRVCQLSYANGMRIHVSKTSRMWRFYPAFHLFDGVSLVMYFLVFLFRQRQLVLLTGPMGNTMPSRSSEGSAVELTLIQMEG